MQTDEIDIHHSFFSLIIPSDDETKLNFVKIAPGSFVMGSPLNEERRSHDSEHQFFATLTRPVWMGIAPVTQKQFAAVARLGNVLPTYPSLFARLPDSDNRPVESITWQQANAFVSEVNRALGAQLPKDYHVSLPTEMIWEYCCRCGSQSAFFFGDAKLDDYAWHSKNSGGTTHSVEQKLPNCFGLYDVLGNVFEMCLDEFSDYPAGDCSDWIGADNKLSHAMRGGAWCSDPDYGVFRSASRAEIESQDRFPFVGMRVCIMPRAMLE